MDKKLQRSRVDRKIGGVFGGIAAYTGISSNALRLIFIIVAFATMKTGLAVVAYLIALFVIPSEDTNNEDALEARRQRAKDRQDRLAARKAVRYERRNPQTTPYTSDYARSKLSVRPEKLYLSREFKFDTATFHTVALEVTIGDVTVKTWEKEEMNMQVNLSAHEGAHTIRQLSEEQLWDYFFQQTTLEINADSLSFTSKKDVLKTDITLVLPNRLYEQLKINLTNGTLKYDNVSVEDAIIKVNYGEILSREAKGKFLNAEVGEGEIFFKKSEIENVEMTTYRGDISLEGHFLSAIALTEHGDVELILQNETATTVDLQAPRGDISIQIPPGWNVDGTLDTKPEKIKFDLKNAKVWDNSGQALVFTQNVEEISTASLKAGVGTGIIKITENTQR